MRKFRDALRAVIEPTDAVLDIGTGTGILAWYAAQLTSGDVVGIEADGAACGLAEKVLASSSGRSPRLHRGFSFGRPIDLDPRVAVSETLGPIGLEENIVEIFWELRRQYPTLERLIPADVSIHVQPVRSAAVRASYAGVLSAYEHAAVDGPGYGAVMGELRDALASTLCPVAAPDAQAAGPALELARFVLGRAKSSAFTARVALPDTLEYDALCLYFDSTLAPGVEITTTCLEPPTHWETFFVAAHPSHRVLDVSFDASARGYRFAWSASPA